MTVAGPSLVVTADDRTGAIETAAACADAGWRATVAPWMSSGELARAQGDCQVIDLRSRHADPVDAQRRVSAAFAATSGVDGTPPCHAHKIDSALRGNWAEELTALVDEGHRVVLIPAHPAMNRVARDGVVLVDGTPVSETEHAADPRRPVTSSRPSDRLPGDELADAGALDRWLTGWSPVAIVDAATLADIDTLVRVAARATGVVVAGPAPVIAAVARVRAVHAGARPMPQPLLPAPVVAACASMHPVGRAQTLGLEPLGVHVVVAPTALHPDSEAVAADVAARAHQEVDRHDARTVILVGGDTAEHFLGDSVVEVFGSVDASVAVGETVVHGRRLRVLTKPGSFGTANTLVDLVKQHAKRHDG
jgi:uncharacterized protein YgbK (DUF1537 family)